MRLRVAKKLIFGRERKNQQARFMFVPAGSFYAAYNRVFSKYSFDGCISRLERTLARDGYSPNEDGWWYDERT